MDNSKHKDGKVTSKVDLGRNLMILRKKKDMSQAELGVIIGVTDVQIGRYEKNFGSLINPKLWKLCEVLGVSLPEMLGIKNDEKGTSEPNHDDLTDELQEARALNKKYRGELRELREKLEECQATKGAK